MRMLLLMMLPGAVYLACVGRAIQLTAQQLDNGHE